jgi:hypothetical protein
MGRDGFVNPLTDRAGMTICLALEVGIMGMDQAQDEEYIEQQIKTER